VANHPFLSVLLYLGIYLLVATLCIPGTTAFLTLVGGFLFGFLGGALLAELASTVGAMLAFFLIRYLFRELVQRYLEGKLQGVYERLKRNGVRYILTVRFTTAFPYFLLNPLLALSPLPSSTFLWTTALGIFPTTLIYAYLGHHFGVVRTHLFRDLLVVFLLPLGAVAFFWPVAKVVFIKVRGQSAG
jgi:uncharacterized membrane protein YdjX (TVP38/TMEM64 family)